MENSKTCSKCAATKPVSEFFFKDVAKTKYRSACRVCHVAAIQQRQMTPEVAEALKVKERARNHARSAYLQDYMQGYLAINKDHLNAMARAREANKPKQVPTSSDVFFLLCQHTGALFTAKTDTAKYCTEGQRLRQNVAIRERSAIEYEKCVQSYTCKHCSHSFAPAYGTHPGKRVYCSDVCRNTAKLNDKRDRGCSHRQRARYYGVAYEPIKVSSIFRLANWHCQACGIATPLEKRGSYDDDAPELDHIMPMSKGGPHLYKNVQCLCRRCNLTKGSTIPIKRYRGAYIYPQANTGRNQCPTP